MSDESNAPADLSNLGIDLSQMFRPSWTTETAGASDATAKLAAKFDEGDRPARGDRHDREGRPGGRGPRREGNRSAGPRGQGGQGGGNRDRGPRPEGRRDGKGGGPRREGSGRGREERRGSHDSRERAPERAPQPALEGWKLSIVPDDAAIEGIAKQVRSRAKAYPLFELARLILQLSDRYNVKLAPESEQTPGFFRAKADGSLWTSRKEAVNHLLAKHLGKFYRKSTVATEPPKGAFTVVAQCGMSGVLLGPPNHHEYTSRIISLHASRFRNMPFEVYKSRIRMVRDEALIEQWKSEQSTKTVYIPLTPGTENEAAATVAPVETPAAELETQAPSVAAEVVESSAEAVAAEESAPVENAAEAPAETSGAAEAPADEVQEATPEETEEAASQPVAEKSEEGGLTLEEAAAHFQEHHAANEVESVVGEITLSGRSALHESTHLLRELLLKNLREMDRFPLPLAQTIGKELTGRGLQIFKSHKKIIHVSMARPRYLDRETTPIGESFRAILEYLEAHPNQRRDKQWAALLALRTETAESTPDTAASLVASPEAEATAGTGEAGGPAVATEAPVSAAPDAETMKKREQALGADLLWLLHQGHVLDFAMGNLQAATRPAPKQAPQPSKKAAAAAESTGSEVVAPSESSEECGVGETDPVAEQKGEVASVASADQEPAKE